MVWQPFLGGWTAENHRQKMLNTLVNILHKTSGDNKIGIASLYKYSNKNDFPRTGETYKKTWSCYRNGHTSLCTYN